jgi:hypothetical protein
MPSTLKFVHAWLVLIRDVGVGFEKHRNALDFALKRNITEGPGL